MRNEGILSNQEIEKFYVLEREGTNDIQNMLEAQVIKYIKWLDDPCTEHELYLFHCEQKSKYEHRKDCPRCWTELILFL